MNIDTHILILLKKYNFYIIYHKYIIFAILSATIKESFYWLLIYFSEQVKLNSNLIYYYGIILIILILLNLPCERYFNYIKVILLEELKKANTKFFYNRAIKLSKTEILNFDLVEFNNSIDHLNDNLDQYIYNLKIKYEIPLRFISLVCIAINKKFNLLIGLFFVYFAIVKALNEWKFIEEMKLNNDYFKYENIIRNYIINSKNLLINNELNMDYLNTNIDKYQKINTHINELNNVLDVKVNICIIIYILIILRMNNMNFSPINFMYYFIIVFDIEYIGDKINEFYKNKIHSTKIEKRLNYLYSFIPIDILVKNNNLNIIKINRLLNDTPKININNIIIKPNDHILINGISGSGKTSLLYVLKGIIKPKIIDIYPDINFINSQTYLTLSNHKSLYSGYLYDIITNYNLHPDISIIINCLKLSNFSKKYDNYFINIEMLSSGERIRLLISRVIYNILINNYNILLFDEIDENLNDDLAIDICTNIRSVFYNKIILYITHNEKVKKLFDKQIEIINGTNYTNLKN